MSDTNVIPFRRPKVANELAVTVSMKSEILYRDDAVMLMRTTATCNGEAIVVKHFMGDLKAGTIAHL